MQRSKYEEPRKLFERALVALGGERALLSTAAEKDIRTRLDLLRTQTQRSQVFEAMSATFKRSCAAAAGKAKKTAETRMQKRLRK